MNVFSPFYMVVVIFNILAYSIGQHVGDYAVVVQFLLNGNLLSRFHLPSEASAMGYLSSLLSATWCTNKELKKLSNPVVLLRFYHSTLRYGWKIWSSDYFRLKLPH